MGQATEIYAREFEALFGQLPSSIQRRIVRKVREMGSRLDSFPHERLQGREEFRLRVGDYRIIYDFNLAQNEVSLVTVGHRRDVYR